MRPYKIYAVYKGEEFLYEGTAKQCAKYFGVKVDTVWFWNCPANKKRDRKGRKIAIIIEEENE